ncbi:hypothetical protein [Ottowia sp.]|uniref:hypothetical protein n=1 Tax=Ottowia sp. TaxID=1898956 RepID=UPI003A84AA67
MNTLQISAAPRRLALALLAALALAGCANIGRTPEEVVTQRVEQRWDALIAGNFEKAWEYTQPAYRGAVKQADYRKQFGSAAQWRGIQVHSVECEAERCKVRIRLTTRMLMPPFRNQEVSTAIDEVWVREDSQWWFYQSF